MCADIKLDVGSDLLRSLGCHDLTTGMKLTLLLGTNTNVLSYSLPDPQLLVTVLVKIKTDESLLILSSQLPIYMQLWSGCNVMQSTHRYGSSFNQECDESSQYI